MKTYHAFKNSMTRHGLRFDLAAMPCLMPFRTLLAALMRLEGLRRGLVQHFVQALLLPSISSLGMLVCSFSTWVVENSHFSVMMFVNLENLIAF